MTYYLERLPAPDILLVGCGGTGSFLAEGLCRLILPYNIRQLLLVDYDTVEERNILRQNFYPDEIGMFKAEALARRLARRFQRPVSYLNRPYQADTIRFFQGILVGCVDNAMARVEIANTSLHSAWWVDAGNGENFGQVLVGNAARHRLRGSFHEEIERCTALPLPTIQQPHLLVPTAPRVPEHDIDPDDPNCAVAVDLGGQSPTINQVMATMVLEVVHQLLEGTCRWMQLYIDMESSTMRSVPATPESAARAAGLRSSRSLIVRKKPYALPESYLA